MVKGWFSVALGLASLWLAAYDPQLRARMGRKPRHSAFRWSFLVFGVMFIVVGLVRVF